MSKRTKRAVNRILNLESLSSRQLMAFDIAASQPSIDVSPEAQLMIELVNRARANPNAEASRLNIDLNDKLPVATISNTPKQPLAPNTALITAADLHSKDMLARNYFDHKSKNGDQPWDRSEDAGYSRLVSENIALRTASPNASNDVASSHSQLFYSAGHRKNLLDDTMSEVGIGIELGIYRYDSGLKSQSMMTTQMFGNASSSPVLTGVVYSDAIVKDDFYTIGEGRANVRIAATDLTSNQVYETSTNSAGSYVLRLTSGTYRVVATQADGTTSDLGNVSIDTQNVKRDALTDSFSTPQPDTLTPVDSDIRAYDCNSDGRITPRDALMVIHHINSQNPDFVPSFDVSRDGRIRPRDVLLVIHFLNQHGSQTLSTGNELSQALEKTKSISNNFGEAVDAHRNSNEQGDILLEEVGVEAVSFLSDYFKLDPSLFRVIQVREVSWPDSSLGANQIASQMVTEGFQSILCYVGNLYEVRSDRLGNFRYASFESVNSHLDDENGFCCPWQTYDDECQSALDEAIDAIVARGVGVS